jgi:hypothetical protein
VLNMMPVTKKVSFIRRDKSWPVTSSCYANEESPAMQTKGLDQRVSSVSTGGGAFHDAE